MSVYVRCRAPLSGFEVWVECGNINEAKGVMDLLAQEGYQAVHPAPEWPKGPDGNPLCQKHRGVSLTRREKQGDVWFSHRVVTPQGEERFCRGMPYGPGERDGYYVD